MFWNATFLDYELFLQPSAFCLELGHHIIKEKRKLYSVARNIQQHLTKCSTTASFTLSVQTGKIAWEVFSGPAADLLAVTTYAVHMHVWSVVLWEIRHRFVSWWGLNSWKLIYDGDGPSDDGRCSVCDGSSHTVRYVLLFYVAIRTPRPCEYNTNVIRFKIHYTFA